MVGQLQRIPGTFVLSSADSIQGGYDMYSIAEVCSMLICCGHIRTVVFDFSASNRACRESALPINGPLGLVFMCTTNHKRKNRGGDVKAAVQAAAQTNVIVDTEFFKVCPESCLPHLHTVVGSPYFMSPEICEAQPYGSKGDVPPCSNRHALRSFLGSFRHRQSL